MTLIRDGIKLGGAYFVLNKLLKKHDQSSSNQEAQQQAGSYDQQPGPYVQQPVTNVRGLDSTQPPPFANNEQHQQPPCYVTNDGFVHADYCDGTCGGRCNIQTTASSAEKGAESVADTRNTAH